MAMIKCKECGNEISDKAKTCVHCGCPISIETRKRVKKKEWNELTTKERLSVMSYRRKIGQYPVVFLIILVVLVLIYTILALTDKDTVFSTIIYFIIIFGMAIIVSAKNKAWYYNHIDELYENGILK